jgi:hypothetical protein
MSRSPLISLPLPLKRSGLNLPSPFDAYLYIWIPKGLKNVGPIFCRITKVIPKVQIDRVIFTYVDEKVVVSKRKCIHIKDLVETFTNMRGAELKLNPKKCVFDMHKGKVLGCLVSMKGIEVNPDNIKAIMHMNPPQLRKDVQKLTGRITVLNRIMSKLA